MIRTPLSLTIGVMAALSLVSAAQAADDPASPPPLSKRTIDSGLPLSANQQATGLDTLDLALKIDPAAARVDGTARYALTALAPMTKVEFDLDPRYAISAVTLNGANVAPSAWRNADGEMP